MIRCLPLEFRSEMRVGVEGQRDVGMTKAFCHRLHGHALDKQKGRAGMTEIVKALLWQAILREEALEPMGHR